LRSSRKLFEIAQERTLFFEQRRGDPARAVAANVAAQLRSALGADPGAGKIITAVAAAFGASDQFADTLLGNEAIVDGNAAAEEGRTRSKPRINAHGVPIGARRRVARAANRSLSLDLRAALRAVLRPSFAVVLRASLLRRCFRGPPLTGLLTPPPACCPRHFFSPAAAGKDFVDVGRILRVAFNLIVVGQLFTGLNGPNGLDVDPLLLSRACAVSDRSRGLM